MHEITLYINICGGGLGGGVMMEVRGGSEMTSSHPHLPLSCSHPPPPAHQMEAGGRTPDPTPAPPPTHTHALTHAHTHTHKALRPCCTYKAVGVAGTQHVEGDAGLCVKVQPPLVVLLREDEVERVPGAPLLGRLHQILEFHPV